MSKTTNWLTRAMYMVFALALVLGMAIIPGTPTVAQISPPSLVPNIDFDVKASIHKVCIDWGDWTQDQIDQAQIDWWLESGVNLDPSDVTVIEPSGPNPYSDNVSYENTIRTKGTIDNVRCIEIRSMKVGDIHIFVELTLPDGTKLLDRPLQAEKKWGELDHTILDVDANTKAVDHTEQVEFEAGYEGTYHEVLKDTVYGSFPKWTDPELIDGAIVHWWAVEDTDANQQWVDTYMDYLAAHNGSLDDDHWAAHGKYMLSDLGGKEPWQYINDWVTEPGDPKYVDPDLFYWSAVNVEGDVNNVTNTGNWYAWAETLDGIATATLSVDVEELVACTTYKVMIVVLVSYPSGSTPQDDPYNGENIVCLEKGKKEFHKGKAPVITQVKTPQLRWAGEKIVLEKDWRGLITGNYSDYMVEYNLESESVGTLHPAGPDDFGFSEGKVFAYLDAYGVSRCILESEQAGEADVDAALYPIRVILPLEQAGETEINFDQRQNALLGEIGFLVYFLEFEDVTLADITPPSSLAVDPEEDVEVAVQVRGFFDYQHSHLMATTRAAKTIDLTGDGNFVILPAGRYVLPDDWVLIAGTKDVSWRPNFDLMDRADLDDITSTNELGPYDTDVRTTDDPGEAKYPTIGPFSTLQPWSEENMWISSATVPSSVLPGHLRNTVVPDGTINKFDAPMPQALVKFDVVSDTGTLSGLDKGDLVGYGVSGLLYQSPFYAVEIPASPFIPAAGYNWDSWGSHDPYDYWEDLGLKSIISNTEESPIDRKDVEVYCDNHGIAGVTVDALDDLGFVTITATAEFPYTPKRAKYGPRVSDDITAIWGAAELPEPNPWFLADKTEVQVGETVTFINQTFGGLKPYVAAEWDFDDDGIVDSTAAVQQGETITWEYDVPGLYNVSLLITDSNDITRKETRFYYINVIGEAVKIWNCPLGGQALIAPNPGQGRPALSVVAACAGITASGSAELWGIYYLVETGPAAGTWKWYIPGFASSTLTQLVPGEYYYVVVSDPCTLTIPQ